MNTLLEISQVKEGLGVLQSTLTVVGQSRHVWIDERMVDVLSQRWHESPPAVPEWDDRYHWNDGTLKTALAVLVLDAWNFCFWPDPGQVKWSIEYKGEKLNGYRALAASVKRAIEEGIDLHDLDRLSKLTIDDLRHIFRGEGEIPMIEERLRNLEEVVSGLKDRWQGDIRHLLEASEGSAVSFVELVVETFPSFDDTALYNGMEVRFYKRAQILAADLAGSLKDEPLVQFHDLHQLTAFADYKIPQVLQAHGVLRYSPQLVAALERLEDIPVGDPQEVEIRATTVWAVELLRRKLGNKTPYELDWMLWNLGQEPVADERPYHRTRTVFY